MSTPANPTGTSIHSVNQIPAKINIDYQENFIIIASVLSIVYGIINAYLVLRIKVTRDLDKSGREVDDENETAMLEVVLQQVVEPDINLQVMVKLQLVVEAIEYT